MIDVDLPFKNKTIGTREGPHQRWCGSLDHDVVVERCVHVNSGSIIKAGATVQKYTKLEAGEEVLGYMEARVQR